MEPIKHPQTARLRSLKMYREDLDEFLGLFQRKCVRVTISDKRYRYESFDEMRKYTGPRIANLDMRAASGLGANTLQILSSSPRMWPAYQGWLSWDPCTSSFRRTTHSDTVCRKLSRGRTFFEITQGIRQGLPGTS